jgi:integration host factor subunit beta
MSTITKKDLIDRISDATQAKRVVVKRIVQQFLDEVVAELAADNRLEFRDFGVFETRTRTARVAQNPKTLERVQVPAKRSVKFKMGRLLKEKLAKIPAAGEPSANPVEL